MRFGNTKGAIRANKTIFRVIWGFWTWFGNLPPHPPTHIWERFHKQKQKRYQNEKKGKFYPHGRTSPPIPKYEIFYPIYQFFFVNFWSFCNCLSCEKQVGLGRPNRTGTSIRQNEKYLDHLDLLVLIDGLWEQKAISTTWKTLCHVCQNLEANF